MYVQSKLNNTKAAPNTRSDSESTSKGGGLFGRSRNKNNGKRNGNRPVSHGYTSAQTISQQHNTSFSAWKVILFAVGAGMLGLLYLNHVFAMQQEYSEVLQLRREYEKIQRIYADRKFTYDRMTGPAEVYSRAKTLGLEDGGPADGIISIPE